MIERRALLWVGEHAIGFVDAFDLLFSQMMMLWVALIAVGMKRQRQEPITLPNLLIRSRCSDPKYFVVINWICR